MIQKPFFIMGLSWDLWITWFYYPLLSRRDITVINNHWNVKQRKWKPKRKLEIKDEFLIMLMKLKLYLLLEYLRDWFGISVAHCGRVCNCWLRLSAKLLQHLIFCLDKEALLVTAATRFEKQGYQMKFWSAKRP